MSSTWSGPRRLYVVAGLIALLQALVLVAGAAPASAHATLVSTDPAEGEVLAETPDVVTFTFDEPVSLTDESIRVFDAAGEPVEADAASADEIVTADLPDALDDGTYVVTYRLVSADGHPVAGSLTFSIGALSETVVPPAVGAEPTRTMKAAVGIVQGLGYLGLLLAAGLVVYQCWILGGVRVSESTHDLLTRVQWGATGLAILAWAAAVPLAGAYQQGFALRGAVGADAIDLSLVGDDLVVLGLVAVGMVLGLLAPRARDFATLGAALAVAAPSVVGHTRAFEPVSLLVATDVLHVAAGATWLGGLAGLMVTLPSLSGRARDASVVLARFSGVAASVLALLVVAGSLLGWRIIGSWSGLFGTTYGRLLLVKVGVVAVVAGIAAWNRYRLVPRARDSVGHAELQRAAGAVRRAVRVEALLVVGILGVTGFLTNQPPRDEPSAASSPAPGRVVSAPIGDFQALIALDPGTRGPNTLMLQIQDRAGEPLDLFATPEVSVQSSTVDLGSLALTAIGAGTYSAPVVFPSSGSWEAAVSLRATEFDNPVTLVELEVE